MSLQCSTERPWGVHSTVRNDEACPRCGWSAPGRRGGPPADASKASVSADRIGWTGQALAA